MSTYPERLYKVYKDSVDNVIELVESLPDSTNFSKRSLLVNCIADRMRLQELRANQSLDQLLDLARIKYKEGNTYDNTYEYAKYLSDLLLSESLDSRATILLLNLGLVGAKSKD